MIPVNVAFPVLLCPLVRLACLNRDAGCRQSPFFSTLCAEGAAGPRRPTALGTFCQGILRCVASVVYRLTLRAFRIGQHVQVLVFLRVGGSHDGSFTC